MERGYISSFFSPTSTSSKALKMTENEASAISSALATRYTEKYQDYMLDDREARLLLNILPVCEKVHLIIRISFCLVPYQIKKLECSDSVQSNRIF